MTRGERWQTTKRQARGPKLFSHILCQVSCCCGTTGTRTAAAAAIGAQCDGTVNERKGMQGRDTLYKPLTGGGRGCHDIMIPGIVQGGFPAAG